MRIRVLHATKKTELGVVELEDDASVEDLNQRIKQLARIAPLRQRIVYDGKPTPSHRRDGCGSKPFLFGKKIREFVPNGSEFEVTVKDLGPQLPYKTLFVLEYLGPLITLPLGYFISKNRSDTAKFGAVIGFLHYFKRELESEYVHVFSNASVPVSGSTKNFIHYWLLYGLLVVGEIFFFKTKVSDWPKSFYWGFAALIAIFEFLNYKCHCTLRDLRKTGSGQVDHHKRGVPRGWGFDSVHCANYTWEILTWITYTIMTKSWMSAAFTAFGAYTMLIWAKKKKKLLLEAFKDDAKLSAELAKKALLIPGLL